MPPLRLTAAKVRCVVCLTGSDRGSTALEAALVKQCIKGQKNSCDDAQAVTEATVRPNQRTVAANSQESLDLAGTASRLVSCGAATINQIRAFHALMPSSVWPVASLIRRLRELISGGNG